MLHFTPRVVDCPSCGASLTVDVAESLNPERDATFRGLILERRLHRGVCARCGERTVVDKALVYLDPGRGLWLWCRPLADRADVAHWEQELTVLFAATMKQRRSNAAVRAWGRTLSPSLVFGYEELRERVLLAEHGLDVRSVELFKREVLLAAPALRLPDLATLLVEEVLADALVLVVVHDDERRGPAVRVSRAALAELAHSLPALAQTYPGLFRPGWQSLRRYRAGAPNAAEVRA